MRDGSGRVGRAPLAMCEHAVREAQYGADGDQLGVALRSV
jgi:hypothetical protein